MATAFQGWTIVDQLRHKIGGISARLANPDVSEEEKVRARVRLTETQQRLRKELLREQEEDMAV